MPRYYFDWAAAAPEEPFEDAVPFGNPSSRHSEGRAAAAALEDARVRAASALGVQAEQLYWTSGASEANSIALFSLLRRRGRTSGGILSGAGEHSSITIQADILRELGIPFYNIALEAEGAVSVKTLGRALEKHSQVNFIAVMLVNNETGAISPLAGLAAFVRSRGGRPVHIHADCVQALGKIPCACGELDIDSASFSAHKIGGPRGIGLLYLRKPVVPLISGGGQERGIRSGTQNVRGALAFARRIEETAGGADMARASGLMARLIRGIRGMARAMIIPEGRGEADKRFSPYIVQMALEDIPGETLVRLLDDAGFAVSTGAACSSREKARPVLDAMGIAPKTAFEAIRISIGWRTNETEIDALLTALHAIAKTYLAKDGLKPPAFPAAL